MNKFIAIITIGLFSIFTSCTEPYAFQNNTFEDVLVIEATVTNELKKQEIIITRTFQLEEKEPTFETNAMVYLTDDLGNQFNFEEENGKYISEFEFQAFPEREYQLFVNTSNGKEYSSTREKISTDSNPLSVNANLKTEFGIDGVEITVNSYHPTHNSNYYRFEYEETYKIVTPYWSENKLNLSYNPTNFIVSTWLTPKNYDSSVCYNTEYSNELLLVNNSGLAEDRIIDFPVRFIPQNNSIIAHRYSILVKQYVQNLEAHTFYKTLNDITSTGSVLSPNQPGFILGNIKNSNDNNERVIGFFDLCSVSKKRIFFNYNDLFEGEAEPNYPFTCYQYSYNPFLEVVDCNKNPPPKNKPPYCEFGKYALYLALVQYESEIYFDIIDGMYVTVKPICGECNRLWSTEVPTFWE